MKKRLALGLLAALGITAGFLAVVLQRPYAGFTGERIVDLPRGTGTRQMARLLAEQGVIRSEWAFLTARALQPRARLQAGEYRFAAPASVWQVMERLARGDVRVYELRVPEGSNLFDISREVGELGFLSADEFRRAASDPSLVRDIDPKAVNLEGYLFPSTYRLTKGATAAQVCRMMTDEFRRVWNKLGSARPPHQVVTLASLVEKETGAGMEREMVASVFQNRLERGIRLECDPTTIYAALLENRYRGTIYRSDLDNQHPYNTYQHAGLPPGPIANPGEASLRAALAPAQSSFLYFVARPEGGRHQFSASLRDHERAVAEYRRGRQGATRQQTGKQAAATGANRRSR